MKRTLKLTIALNRKQLDAIARSCNESDFDIQDIKIVGINNLGMFFLIFEKNEEENEKRDNLP